MLQKQSGDAERCPELPSPDGLVRPAHFHVELTLPPLLRRQPLRGFLRCFLLWVLFRRSPARLGTFFPQSGSRSGSLLWLGRGDFGGRCLFADHILDASFQQVKELCGSKCGRCLFRALFDHIPVDRNQDMVESRTQREPLDSCYTNPCSWKLLAHRGLEFHRQGLNFWNCLRGRARRVDGLDFKL